MAFPLCVTWLVFMRDVTHSYMCHDSFVCATWLTGNVERTISGDGIPIPEPKETGRWVCDSTLRSETLAWRWVCDNNSIRDSSSVREKTMRRWHFPKRLDDEFVTGHWVQDSLLDDAFVARAYDTATRRQYAHPEIQGLNDEFVRSLGILCWTMSFGQDVEVGGWDTGIPIPKPQRLDAFAPKSWHDDASMSRKERCVRARYACVREMLWGCRKRGWKREGRSCVQVRAREGFLPQTVDRATRFVRIECVRNWIIVVWCAHSDGAIAGFAALC